MFKSLWGGGEPWILPVRLQCVVARWLKKLDVVFGEIERFIGLRAVLTFFLNY